jgi:hypothetical protein
MTGTAVVIGQVALAGGSMRVPVRMSQKRENNCR